jgi:hypothetical protein
VGAGSVEIPPAAGRPAPIAAALTKISIAGIAFETDQSAAFLTPGSSLRGVRIRIGDCVLTGDVAIRDTRATSAARMEIGGVFVPANDEVEMRLMALLSGFAAALGD